MKVQDCMRPSPKSCGPETSLAEVSHLLCDRACGALPVVDVSGKVIGIITDRDICLALGKQNRRPSELRAKEAMSCPATVCRANDEIHGALNLMKSRKVRRLPVVSEAGTLEGILCLSDLILEARHDDGSRPELTYEDVMSVLHTIYWVHSVRCRTETVAAS